MRHADYLTREVKQAGGYTGLALRRNASPGNIFGEFHQLTRRIVEATAMKEIDEHNMSRQMKTKLNETLAF